LTNEVDDLNINAVARLVSRTCARVRSLITT
jgi:hypothetical protein